MGKPQKLISTQAVHKVWHLIVGGIEKLDYQSDAQLQKVFTDLIVKWIPQFRLVRIKIIIFDFDFDCIKISPNRFQFKRSFQSHLLHVLVIANSQHYSSFLRK